MTGGDYRYTRREFLKSSASGVFSASALGGLGRASEKKRSGKPNVIFIMTDQQRASTVSCYGRNEQIHTPAIDRLARRGIRFNSCYATQPVCSPSRSSMVTGLYPNATGVEDNCTRDSGYYLDEELFTWLRHMHETDYKVCYIGKWHLGNVIQPVPAYFDVWHGYETRWGHWVVNPPRFSKPGEMQPKKGRPIQPCLGEKPLVDAEYRPDEETDFAIDFIKKNRERPFVCWLSYYPPHTPKTAPEADVEFYKGKVEPEGQAIYQAMVHRIDYNVGRILNAVDSYGLTEDTIVIFTSDHGENFPLRWNKHYKRLCYDQSANVPLIFSWPGTLPEEAVIEEVISNVDLAPTILDLCGLKWPGNLHGQSAKLLMGGYKEGWRDDVLIENNPYRDWRGEHKDMRERCVVTDEWKLILNTKREPELMRRGCAELPEDNEYKDPERRQVVVDLFARLDSLGDKVGDELTKKLVKQWRKG